MIELIINIIGGKRLGESLTLYQYNKNNNDQLHFLREDEPISLELHLPETSKNINLIIYDIEIPFSTEKKMENGTIIYTWNPVYTYGKPESFFQNYFGTAEIYARYEDNNESINVNFQKIEILASKWSAKNVEHMLDYLSEISSEYLFSAFHVTKKHGGIELGNNTPELTIEKTKKITEYLESIIPHICHFPITKLSVKYKVNEFNEYDTLDDNTISWICTNLSILEPTDIINESILIDNGKHYRAPVIEVPTLHEDTDIYENRAIHGFIDNLISEIKDIQIEFLTYSEKSKAKTSYKGSEYKSFFHIMSKFTQQLTQPKQRQCTELAERLLRIKFHLQKSIPVSQVIRNLPHVTPKVRVNKYYLDIFYQIIIWNSSVKPNWDIYDTLLGIKNIPILFEYYTYCRVVEILNDLYDCNNQNRTEFVTKNQIKINILKEPNYWTLEHIQSKNKKHINTEGWSDYDKKLCLRGKQGENSRRSPDIVIEIEKPNGEDHLIILDAKYTYSYKAFSHYLPELTMKYVHGIHTKKDGKEIVDSLTIIYPDEISKIKSFHNEKFSFDSKTPIKPALQTISIIPNKKENDDLQYLIKNLLQLSQVDI